MRSDGFHGPAPGVGIMTEQLVMSDDMRTEWNRVRLAVWSKLRAGYMRDKKLVWWQIMVWKEGRKKSGTNRRNV